MVIIFFYHMLPHIVGRTCGGWGLQPGQHTDSVCRTEGTKELDKHICCDGSLARTAEQYDSRNDVPICLSKY